MSASDAITTRTVLALLECLEEAQKSEAASQLVVVLIGWTGQSGRLAGRSIHSLDAGVEARASFETTEIEL